MIEREIVVPLRRPTFELRPDPWANSPERLAMLQRIQALEAAVEAIAERLATMP